MAPIRFVPAAAPTSSPKLREGARCIAFALACILSLPLGAASGGPDGYGYTWRDSNEGVPVEDIPFDGAPSFTSPAFLPWLSSPDVAIGFDFFFYGIWYDTLQISDDGWVSFVEQAEPHPVPGPIPGSEPPEAFVAPLWDDLGMMTIQWGSILGGDGFKVEWQGLQPTDFGPMNAQFAVYLFRDGGIRFTWFLAEDNEVLTVGIEGESQQFGSALLVEGDASGGFALGDGYAVEFRSPGTLNCAAAVPLSCGEALASAIPPDLVPTNALTYCSQNEYAAAEQVFTVEVDRPLDIEATISGFGSRGLDLFLLGSCERNDCVTGGMDSIRHFATEAGTYALAVDGADVTDAGPFDISLNCADPFRDLECGEILSGSTLGEIDRKDRHSCASGGNDYDGGESWFALCLDDATTLRLRLDTSANLDLIAYQEDLDSSSCVAWGDTSLTFLGAGAGCYYIAVDGPAGEGGDFTIEADCGSVFDCAAAVSLDCGERIVGDTSRDGYPGVDQYSCTPETYDGPEVLLSLANPRDQGVSLVLESLDPELDLLVLEEGMCDEGFCSEIADAEIDMPGLPAGSYPVVVDGRGGTGGPFTLTAYCGRSLSPGTVEGTLEAGQGMAERKSVTLTPHIGQADLMFAVDLTASMEQELENLQANAKRIINETARLVEDLRFGLIGFEDYPVVPFGQDNCGRTARYGAPDDEPYRLELPLTDDIAAFEAAVDALALGDGGDAPEAYSRALYESTADPGIGWRPDARKLLLSFGDDMPHDCNAGACAGLPGHNWGKDLGRDAVAGTSDDLAILDVLDAMASEGVTLLHFDSSEQGRFLPHWECYAEITGGMARSLDPDGTVPEGQDLAGLVFETLLEQARDCGTMTLSPAPGYANWLFNVFPRELEDVRLPLRTELDIVLGPPPGIQPGDYSFTMDLRCDGEIVAQQQVSIHVGDCAVPDVAPPAVRASLRVSKSQPEDLRLTWSDLSPAEVAGSYQVLALDADRVSAPDPLAMEAADLVGEVDPAVEELLHLGALRRPCPLGGTSPCRLLFYKVRGTSPCSGIAGSLCNGFPGQAPCP